MVYRGKPSAGCDSCRKSKKRCTLEIPTCTRCLKLKRQCTGYRDTTQLQIHDETEAVQLKAERQRAQYIVRSAPLQVAQYPVWAECSPTIGSNMSNFDNGKDDWFFSLTNLAVTPRATSATSAPKNSLLSISVPIPPPLRTNVEDLATTHFFNRFTSAADWNFLRGYASNSDLDPCLKLTIQACGMAALDNVESVIMGRDYARSMYVKALGLLNAALRDPVRCTTDECLVAVALLGYYESITCDSKQSVQSWKAHVTGCTQLLKLRGKQQLSSNSGRTLFRTTRAQIMMHCIWDDVAPDPFLWDWQDDLERQTPDYHLLSPADDLAKLCHRFAKVRARIKGKSVSDVEAADLLADIDCRMIEWSIDTMSSNPLWQYRDLEVQESPHVWNGIVHVYTQQPVHGVWNTYRSVRILLTRCQEDICCRLSFNEAEREEQMRYFRRVRRQMTEEICAGIPAQLGHDTPGYNTPCVLISAHNAIWPLFFAGNCALGRVGTSGWINMQNGSAQTSAAFAQLSWIIGRLEYISEVVGLRFAGGIADVLKGDSRIHDDLLADVKGAVQDSTDLRYGRTT